MKKRDLGGIKSLMHFDDEILDEVSQETWSCEDGWTYPTTSYKYKFGVSSLDTCDYGALLCTNHTGIWNMNSNKDYEIEFFFCTSGHGNDAGTRELFKLLKTGLTETIFALSLTPEGCLEFISTGWGITEAITGKTIVDTEDYTWHHLLMRITQQELTIYLNGLEELSAELSNNITLRVEKAGLGYLSNWGYHSYIDEFVFRHTVGTGEPIIPDSAYLTSLNTEPQKKRNFGTIKSLLHFDYPYFNEPNDGLGDEIGIETWSKNGTITLCGNIEPKAGTFTPKFGYRCLYTSKGSVQCNNESGIWNLSSEGKYEIGMFVCITETDNEKNIFSLMDSIQTVAILKLSISSGGKLSFASSIFGVESVSGATVITTNIWHHVLMRISDRHMMIYLDGNLEINTGLLSKTELEVGQTRIGNDATSYAVYIDEFVFQHSAGNRNPKIPTKPYNGTLKIREVDSIGTGRDGAMVISEDNIDEAYGVISINSSGWIDSISGKRSFTVEEWGIGVCKPSIGCEVIIHITGSKDGIATRLLGLYAFSHITSCNGTKVEIEDEITLENGYDFTLSGSLLAVYYVQVLTVPNYRSFVLPSGYTIEPNPLGSGIVAFRCRGNCNVEGSIITLGYGFGRNNDLHQMTHSKLLDRFLLSSGGGIFITCGGTFTASSSARLGASWSGLGENGNGATGYGGDGGNVSFANGFGSIQSTTPGGAGGVGGGGGGSAMYTGNYRGQGANVGKNGSNSYSGGGGGGCGGKGGNAQESLYGAPGAGGGGQGGSGGNAGAKASGITEYSFSSRGGVGGGNGGRYADKQGRKTYGAGGGGAPGGSGGRGGPSSSKGNAGASIILVSRRLKVEASAISTGGEVGGSIIGKNNHASSTGGGGTGFCYIAYEEQVSE